MNMNILDVEKQNSHGHFPYWLVAQLVTFPLIIHLILLNFNVDRMFVGLAFSVLWLSSQMKYSSILNYLARLKKTDDEIENLKPVLCSYIIRYHRFINVMYAFILLVLVINSETKQMYYHILGTWMLIALYQQAQKYYAVMGGDLRGLGINPE